MLHHDTDIANTSNAEVFLAEFVFCHVAFLHDGSHLNKRRHFADAHNSEELSLAFVIGASVTDLKNDTRKPF